MFGFFKRNKKQKTNKDLIDERGNIIKESSIVYDKHEKRFLKLDDSTCAIVLYEDGNVEIVFTKSRNNVDQEITENEEILMALSLFMKQPGFLEMILTEFRKIAMEKITILTGEENK
jgi:hypothetical protein